MRLLAVLLLLAAPVFAQRYDIGAITVRDVWVDPNAGSDTNDGVTRATALRTLSAAWAMIPRGETLAGTGYRIQLMAGTHPRDSVPTYFEERYGTAQFPIIIQSADGSRTARVLGDLNIFDTRYLYLIGLDLRPDPPGDVVHCEQCDHLLVRDSHLDGGARQARETFKANQSRHVYIESSTIHGAYDNAVDFVAVQHGHVIDSRIYDAEDWCMYTKGGSAYFRIERNEIFQCGTGGFTAGQGTGFQYMTPPWLHYEAYDVKVVNNVIHDTQGAGLGVNGGYNILMAHNTMVRTGVISHLFEVVFGGRTCDGPEGEPSRVRCQQHLDMGGWGSTMVTDEDNYVRIPNRNVFVYNNVFYNPTGVVSSQHFTIFGTYERQMTPPAVADTNLRIRGNVIFNELGDLGIGEISGCQPSNPTCNAAQLRADNTINAVEPQLASYRATNLAGAPTFAIPDFSWSDAPAGVPAGTLSNAIAPAGAVAGVFAEVETTAPRRRSARR